MLLAGTVFPLWSGYEPRVALVVRFLRSGASYSGLLGGGLAGGLVLVLHPDRAEVLFGVDGEFGLAPRARYVMRGNDRGAEWLVRCSCGFRGVHRWSRMGHVGGFSTTARCIRGTSV